MMNQQPDKIFRDKLQGYQQPVPSGTWNRVSQNLTSDNRRMVWLRVAATVLVVITSGIFLYPALKKSAVTPLSENTIKSQPQKPAIAKPAPEDSSPLKNDENKSAHAPGNTQRDGRTQNEKFPQRPEVAEKTLPLTGVDQNEHPTLATTENTEAILEAVAEDAQTPEQETTPSDLIDSNRKSVTIVFTTNEVNEKYLTKKADAGATQETKEASGFKRLLDKAYDLKNNQDLLGDLRQKKNEILAMNFKSDKQDTIND